jgi:hypothetical protein
VNEAINIIILTASGDFLPGQARSLRTILNQSLKDFDKSVLLKFIIYSKIKIKEGEAVPVLK